MALLASLIAVPDATLDAPSCIVERCLLATARGHLPACRSGAVHDRLIVNGVLGDDIVRLVERASEEAAVFALPQALFTATGQCA
jgi:hypothetical protein